MLVKSDFLHQELVSSFTRVMIETLFWGMKNHHHWCNMDVKQKANIVTCAWNYGFQFFLYAKDGVMRREETHI
jgi:hypothetical protein